MITLNEAKANWKETVKIGGVCPCCDRFGKIYSRPINESMIRAFLWVWTKYGTEWVNIPENAPQWLVRTNQLPTLRWWALVERDEDCFNKKNSGIWRITEKGKEFALGRIQVQKNAITYNGEPIGFEGKMVDINSKYGKFNYHEIMQRVNLA